MKKYLLLSLLLLTPLSATEVTPENLHAIYTEAIFFVLVFGLMSLISYIYSNRHAKQYTKDQADKVAQTKAIDIQKRTQKQERLADLSKLVQNGILTDEEFQILRSNL